MHVFSTCEVDLGTTGHPGYLYPPRWVALEPIASLGRLRRASALGYARQPVCTWATVHSVQKGGVQISQDKQEDGDESSRRETSLEFAIKYTCNLTAGQTLTSRCIAVLNLTNCVPAFHHILLLLTMKKLVSKVFNVECNKLSASIARHSQDPRQGAT